VNHLPFENWLLNDMPISPEQQRELDAHVRNCSYCSALAETGRLLNTKKMAVPATGFTMRFQSRLAARKIEERRRKLLGGLLFVLGGSALVMWLTAPYVLTFLAAPSTWISVVVSWFIYLETTLVALANAGFVIFTIIPRFMPPFAWMILISAFAGVSLLWSVSIWRFAQRGATQGV
jgi:hypothetical protein